MKDQNRGTRFSRFAQTLYKFQPYEDRIKDVYAFTFQLLKAGLDCTGEEYVDELFPSTSDRIRGNGRDDIKQAKKEQENLRNYFSGRRDISIVADDINEYFHRQYFRQEMDKYKKVFPEIRKQLEASGELFDKRSVSYQLAIIFESILKEAANAKFAATQNRLNARMAKTPAEDRYDVEQMKQLPKNSIKDNNIAETVFHIPQDVINQINSDILSRSYSYRNKDGKLIIFQGEDSRIDNK
ncbi:MAG: hypothetical protein IKI58_10560 [Oscillospiraceae bacterium]|nr:hypothetical protein [Oscillospiraceae bacterium]